MNPDYDYKDVYKDVYKDDYMSKKNLYNEWTDYDDYNPPQPVYLPASSLQRGELYKHSRHGLVVFVAHSDTDHIGGRYAKVVTASGKLTAVRNSYFQEA